MESVKYSIAKEEPFRVLPAAKSPGGLYFLSDIDQIFAYPMKIVFSYKGKGNGTNKTSTEVLKTALAKVLVEFYPLAGCLTTSWDGKMLVKCNGEGVPFVEATCEHKMELLGDITNINSMYLSALVHYNEKAQNLLDVPPLTVQVTTFKCGGIVVGVAFNHTMFDGISFTDFMKSWAEVARGMPLSVLPHLDRSILSPKQSPILNITHDEYIKQEKRLAIPLSQNVKFIGMSFCFDKKTFCRLRLLAMEGKDITMPPTNFELISALLWINWTKALKIKPEVTTQILTAVDGRPKFKPPLPNCYFGNGIVISCAQSKAGELAKKPFSFAVKIVHEAIISVTENYTKSAIDRYEVVRQQLESPNTLRITKWSRLPFYEINCGWGEPEQVAPASLLDNLAVYLSQGKDSENIVVSLSLPSVVMERFEELMKAELE